MAYANSLGMWWVAGLVCSVILIFDWSTPLWYRLLWVPIGFAIVLALAASIRARNNASNKASNNGRVVTFQETVRSGLRQTPKSLTKPGAAFEVGVVLRGADARAHFAAFRGAEGPIRIVLVNARWPNKVARELDFGSSAALREWGDSTQAVYVRDEQYAAAVTRKYFDPLL
ncbi:hypothetical protein [Microbacterium cremeum]|uniref:hypothetical protein n=1 Tax=Microbacterium cremeum TaxID=2782169 RepID=UPI001888176D|nr:hypothetical protein [Microbacterium cremeum]